MKKLKEGEKFQVLMDELKTVKDLDELIEYWLMAKGIKTKNDNVFVHQIPFVNLLKLQETIFSFYGYVKL